MMTKRSNLATRPNYSTPKIQADGCISPRRYHAYLLRFWQEEEGEPWRIQVEHPHTREVFGFSNMERLMQFLSGQLSVEEKR
ncbi:MAG: hypothetical protein HYZ21_03520 [Chloroflexi bacterium]|nr:hypothetical protein [Chloroflexota bacterium]